MTLTFLTNDTELIGGFPLAPLEAAQNTKSVFFPKNGCVIIVAL